MNTKSRIFDITLVYQVSIHEEDLFKHYRPESPEDAEGLRRIFNSILSDPNTANYLMLRAISFSLADTAEREYMPEILTGYPIDDHTPIKELVKTLPPEDREYFDEMGDFHITNTLENAIRVELDHTHVSHAHEQPSGQEPREDPTRERHHKRKPRRRK